MKNIIVASSDTDQLEELQNGAREIAKLMSPRAQVDIRFASSVEQIAKKRNAETFLVIVAATLPDCRKGASADPESGLSFARSLAADRSAPPCILVSENEDYYKIVQSIRRCELLQADSSTNYLEHCVQLARRLNVIADESEPSPSIAPELPDTETQRSSKKFALLEVKLPENANFGIVCLERYECLGTPRKPEQEVLQLDQSELLEMIKDSNELRENLSLWQQDPLKWQVHYDQWHRNYRQLGERVSRLLWGSTSFSKLYNRGHGWADGNIRLRFNLEEPWFEGLWEAIPGQQRQRHLILDNIVARRAIPPDEVDDIAYGAPRIETDDGALNMLVVQSEVPPGSTPKGPDDRLWDRYWESRRATLPMLPHLEEEVIALRDIVVPSKKVRGVARVQLNIEVLKPPKSPSPGKAWSLAEKLENRLTKQSRRYDIVHFAGHALFNKGPVREDSRGYLVCSGFPQPEAVPIASVASWLKEAGVQLAYLSCCRSSAASAALELARNEVPMAIGFHWDLDDRKAAVFAKHFYEALLEAELKVCSAISKARSVLFRKHAEGDPIWASPVLIAQPFDWNAVEGALKLAAGPKADLRTARDTRRDRRSETSVAA